MRVGGVEVSGSGGLSGIESNVFIRLLATQTLIVSLSSSFVVVVKRNSPVVEVGVSSGIILVVCKVKTIGCHALFQ